MKIPLLVFMCEIKIDLTLKKSNFLFLLCFKLAKIKFILLLQQSRQRNSFYSSRFYIKFDTSSVFTGYDTGCKQSLQLKNSLKFLFAKQMSRNRTRKNA